MRKIFIARVIVVVVLLVGTSLMTKYLYHFKYANVIPLIGIPIIWTLWNQYEEASKKEK